jgi:hypothetical protein
MLWCIEVKEADKFFYELVTYDKDSEKMFNRMKELQKENPSLVYRCIPCSLWRGRLIYCNL